MRTGSLITSIVFSRNRPLQLDLCLNSVKKNLPECSSVVVIHKNSEEFASAHETLEGEHSGVSFCQQGKSIFRNTLESVISADTDYICFLTDDNICFSGTTSIPYQVILSQAGVACVSLRLGLNISERSHLGVIGKDTLASYHEYDNFIAWSKTAHTYGSYWSYSLSVDGHVFRQQDLIEMLDELSYLEDRRPERWKQTPNELESAIQRFWATTPNLMVAPRHSCIVNSPNNRVQDSHPDNTSGEYHGYNAGYLLGKYMNGSRINLEYLDFSNIKCPHTEIDLMAGLYDK